MRTITSSLVHMTCSVEHLPLEMSQTIENRIVHVHALYV